MFLRLQGFSLRPLLSGRAKTLTSSVFLREEAAPRKSKEFVSKNKSNLHSLITSALTISTILGSRFEMHLVLAAAARTGSFCERSTKDFLLLSSSKLKFDICRMLGGSFENFTLLWFEPHIRIKLSAWLRSLKSLIALCPSPSARAT